MLKQKIVGKLAYIFTRILYCLLKVNIYAHARFDLKTPCIFAFWHGQLFLPIMSITQLDPARGAAGLVSPSRDGEILSTWLKQLGFKVIRGSSSRQGAKGVVGLLQAARQGYSLGIACDGPRGPIYKIKPGTIFLAQKSGLPIVPLGVAYQSAKQFGSWDQFKLPWPFSKSVLYIGAPCYISATDTPEEAEKALKDQLAQAIKEANHLLAYPKQCPFDIKPIKKNNIGK